MISLSDLIYFLIFGAALLLCMMGLWFTAIMPGLDRWGKRFFLRYFSVLMMGNFAGFAGMFMACLSVSGTELMPLLILECLGITLPTPMLTTYLLHTCGEPVRESRLFGVVAGLWAICAVLLLSNLFTYAFMSVEPDGEYSRGPWYPLILLPLAAAVLLNLAGLLRRRKQLSRNAFRNFLIALLPMALTLLVQMFVDITPLLFISSVVSGECMYSLMLSDQIEQDLRRQREIAEQQRRIAGQERQIAEQHASIMVLQMRPHFIYNTLTSIYCLCSQDPPLAQRIILDFTTYLRKNFTAIASDKPIPFTSELEHTQAYLAVEQARFSSTLRVEYDTPHILFRVPPLTLQPIVENAVKHGRNPVVGTFHIAIRTRKTDSGSEIVVADNGPGVDPADDNEPHIALKNIRQRLALMCGGSLTIGPNDGGGTVVTLTIPDGPRAQ